jgi:hypothetical protein
MSFHIHAAGTVGDTITQVEAIRWVPENMQAEQTRNYILQQLYGWPTTPNSPKGVLVEASGHADQFSRNVTLTLRPLYLQLPEADGGE